MSVRGQASAIGILTAIATMVTITIYFHPGADYIAPLVGGPLGFGVSSLYIAVRERGKR